MLCWFGVDGDVQVLKLTDCMSYGTGSFFSHIIEWEVFFRCMGSYLRNVGVCHDILHSYEWFDLDSTSGIREVNCRRGEVYWQCELSFMSWYPPSTLHSTPFLQNPSPYHIWEYILNLILIWHFCSNPDHLFNFNWNLWPSRPEKVNINHFDEHISFDIFPKSITKDFSLSRPFLDIYQNPNNANNLSLPAASKSLQIRHVEIYYIAFGDEIKIFDC